MSNYRPNLSDQEVRFCDEYLVSFNVYRAAIAAGYSEDEALKGELLHIPKIQEYLKLKQDHRAESLEISHDMILREFAKIAFSSMGNYYDERGDLRPMGELSERDKAAISQYEFVDVVGQDGYKVGKITKIKLHNKMSALDKIARHLGFYEGKKPEAGSLKQEAFGEVAVAVAAAVEDFEEVAAAVASEEVGFGEEEQGGKILTLSPLFGRDVAVVDNQAANDGELVTAGVDDFMQELLRGKMIEGLSD